MLACCVCLVLFYACSTLCSLFNGGIRPVNSAVRLVKEVAGSDMLGNWQHKANEVLLSGLETIQDYEKNPNAPKFQVGDPPIFQAGSSNESSNCSTPTPEKFPNSNSPMVNRTEK